MPFESIQTKTEPGEILIKIQLPAIPTTDNSHTQYAEVYKTVFNGKRLDLITEANFLIAKDGVLSSTINIDVSDGVSFPANILITFHKGSSDVVYTANTNVVNHSRELRGLGRALWVLATKFIQEYANKSGVPVKHFVLKSPTKGLEDYKWDEILLPSIKARAYKPVPKGDKESWEKIYTPQAQ